MSTVVKIIGIVLAIIGSVGFASTMYAYNDATMKMGLNVLTSPIAEKTLEYFVGEAIIIGIGVGIFGLGVKLCRHS